VPGPFSLARFAHFLHDQHCIEVLAFTQAIASYRASYHAHFPSASAFAHVQPPPQHPHSLWRDLIDTYVSTRAAHQVNLQGRVRENLLAADRDRERRRGPDGDGAGAGPPPEPGVLSEAEESTLELLRDVFAHFVERAAAAVSSCPVTPAASRLRRRCRCGGGGEGKEQGAERKLSRANDVWGARMHRNIGFCRELAVKAGNLVRGREGDRERRRRG